MRPLPNRTDGTDSSETDRTETDEELTPVDDEERWLAVQEF